MKERPILFSGENWAPVIGFEDRYLVSDGGQIMSQTNYRKSDGGRIMKPWVQNRGYLYVTLRDSNGGKRAVAVHRAVLEAFVGPCPEGRQTAHEDGDPSNNALSNLRWATAKENHRDRRRHGRIPVGEDCASAKLDVSAVSTIKKLKEFCSAYEVAHLACVNPGTITAIWEGKTWRHI